MGRVDAGKSQRLDFVHLAIAKIQNLVTLARQGNEQLFLILPTFFACQESALLEIGDHLVHRLGRDAMSPRQFSGRHHLMSLNSAHARVLRDCDVEWLENPLHLHVHSRVDAIDEIEGARWAMHPAFPIGTIDHVSGPLIMIIKVSENKVHFDIPMREERHGRRENHRHP